MGYDDQRDQTILLGDRAGKLARHDTTRHGTAGLGRRCRLPWRVYLTFGGGRRVGQGVGLIKISKG